MSTAIRCVIAGALGASIISGVVAASPGASAAIPPEALGQSAAGAAGSCWEIKQARPSAPNGAYWLLTSKMAEPQRFYCDMTTDGGGWVLVGKGRNGWSGDYLGKGSAADLLTPDTVPMSGTTRQLSSRVIDALLDGGRIDALADGVRFRRAMDTAGATWQESRLKLANRGRWAWTFGAEHPIASYSFGSRSGTGGTTASYGLDSGYQRIVNTPIAANSYRLGFGYGSQVAGTASDSSYLWSATNGAGGALPYTQVYLRPRVTSGDATFRPIADAGVPGWTRPAVPRSNALVPAWGVGGVLGSTVTEGSVEVQAFTQSGNRMYVGGNFAYVQRDAQGTGRVQQPFLAAFDVATGEWVPTFRPVLNEQVRALATLPNGQILAGGDFSQANGRPATAVVALDPTTGMTSDSWSATLETRVTGAALRVRALDVAGPHVYIGGNVTHFAGGQRPSTFSYMRMLGRVSSSDGTPSTGWNPNLNGAVMAVDGSADGSRVYAAGHFTTSNGASAKNAAAILNAAGAPLAAPAWTPTWSSTKSYQQAIQEASGSVFVGGSEHSLFQFDTSTFQRTSGSIMKRHGDIQAINVDRGVVYAGCHCDGWSYQNAFTWPTLTPGWNEADTLNWFGAWDAATGRRIPDFVPVMNMRLNQGIWALATDSNGTTWAGGDMVTVQTPNAAAQWSGGFARFPQVDSTAPNTHGSLRVTAQTATSVTLAWSTVSDQGGGVRYQILRDDRPIAATSANTGSITVPKGGSNRFFLRSVDAAGNYSATTAVVQP